MKQQIRLGLLALTMAMSGLAQAATELPELVVSAGRIAQDPAQVSADTTVITREQIDQSQKISVADLLREYVGIDVAASGGPGKTTSVFMRGGNSGHTLVLIDGVRVGSATTGSFEWAHLSTADIERIEIVRGPQSSLYGADAMGGVIQIFTRKGQAKPRVSVETEAGSYGTTSGSMSVSGGTEAGMRYALTAAGLRTQGVSAAAGGAEPDGYRRTTLSGQVSLPLGAGRVSLNVRNVEGRSAYDNSGWTGPIDAAGYFNTAKQSIGSVRLDYPVNEAFETSLQVSRSLDTLLDQNPAGTSDIHTRIDQLTWQNTIDWETVSLVFGLDMHRDRGINPGRNIDKKITQAAPFAAAGLHVSKLDLNAAIRSDRNSASPNKTTYKLGAALHPLEGLKLTANYGTGFKAPSINDLYWPATAWSAGNPNLKPESSKGWDAGLKYDVALGDAQAGFGIVRFVLHYKNLITWAPDAGGIWKPQNVGKAGTRGWEISAHLNNGPAYLRANWTRLDARNIKDGTLLPRRARDSGAITAGLDVDGVNVAADVRIVGPRFSGTGNSSPMAGYHTTGLRAAYTIDEHWQVKARVDNLENKHYEEVKGYGVLGRAWYAGVNASF